MKKLMMIAAVVAVVSAFAADVKVVAKDYDEQESGKRTALP